MLVFYIFLIASLASILSCQSINTANCGQRPLASTTNKIVGGVRAKPGDWSWSVSIATSGRHFCGGVLINEQWVLTAGHCFKSLSSVFIASLTVDIGVHDRYTKESWTKIAMVSKVLVHQSFSFSTLINDIALVKLDSPITLDNKYYIPACVPDIDTFDYTSVNQTGWLTGWGAQLFGGTSTREKFQVSMVVLPDTRCVQKYVGYTYDTKSQMCAGEPGLNIGACQGDSGGPFVRQMEDGKWYVIGLISWGIDCGLGTVFTRVTHFLPWINNIILNN